MNTQYLDDLFLKETEAVHDKKLVISRPLRVKNVDNGILIPSVGTGGYAGLVDEDGEYEALSSFPTLAPLDGYVGKSDLDLNNLDVENFGNDEVIYLGHIRNHWGHFLMDSLSRIWYLLQDNPNKKAIYFGEKIVHENIIQFFEMIGIDINQLIFINKPTKFDNIIVPEASFVPGKHIHKDFLLAFDKITSNIEINHNIDKVYLSRTNLSSYGKTEWGENKIEEQFKQNGYKIVYPEKLSFLEQIKILKSAKEIVCVSGTLPHTLVFAQEKTKVIVINKSIKRENYRQVGIDEIKKFDITYIDAHISLLNVGAGGPFWLKFNDNLKNYFQDNKLTFINKNRRIDNIKIFTKYIIVATIKNVGSLLRYHHMVRNYVFRDGEYKTKVYSITLINFYLKKCFRQ